MSDSAKPKNQPRIVVAGAGSIGCFIGGMLARAGRDVTLLMRPATQEEIGRHGLSLTDYEGLDEALSPGSFAMETDPACLANAGIILVTVKSGATAVMAAQIARHAPNDAVVVSLQNGVQNVETLRSALPGRDVRAGMVPFNVVWVGGGRFHRGTSGEIAVEKGKKAVGRHLSCLGLEVHERRDLAAVQWGKLVINLNNALNALASMPLRQQIWDMRWRRLMAAQMVEALSVLQAAGIKPHNPVANVPMGLVPFILRLPTWAFRWVARTMLAIDPNARSSMWEDLDRGRSTEIEELQGQIVRLARKNGIDAPINGRIAAMIRAVEAEGAGAPGLSAREVQKRLRKS